MHGAEMSGDDAERTEHCMMGLIPDVLCEVWIATLGICGIMPWKWNASAASLLKRLRDMLVGRKLFRLFPPLLSSIILRWGSQDGQ